ncbi:MAG TPA: VOC family protein [Acidobacteriota bacterium]|nr:VOC family protein [Acidobacteriota bacterium]
MITRNLFLVGIFLLIAGVVMAQEKSQMAGPRLYRIILPVGDIERAAKFYTQLMGAEGMRVSSGRHYFDCGGVILALYDPKADGDKTVARPNFEHIYFAVSDLEAVYKRAETLGGLSTEIGDGGLVMGKMEKRPWGERSFYMKDPFDNPLCFVDERTLFTGR